MQAALTAARTHCTARDWAETSLCMLSPGLGSHAAEDLSGVAPGLVAKLDCSQTWVCLIVAAAGGA